MASKVLITGMTGVIGTALREHLGKDHLLRALNRRNIPDVDCHVADIADLDAIVPAFDGIDTVVHMAAHSGEAEFDVLLQHNIIGTYNVFEAARRAGCRRIIAASSGSVVTGWESEAPYDAIVDGNYDNLPASWPKLTHETPVRPSGLYGCSKAWLEALGRHFADSTELSVICLRIGRVMQVDRPVDPRHYAVWCSRRDLASLVRCCIDAPDELSYEIFYALSDNRWGFRDLEHAQRLVGFHPQDHAEDYR